MTGIPFQVLHDKPGEMDPGHLLSELRHKRFAAIQEYIRSIANLGPHMILQHIPEHICLYVKITHVSI